MQKKDIPLGDMLNMAFMSSIVVNGHAKKQLLQKQE